MKKQSSIMFTEINTGEISIPTNVVKEGCAAGSNSASSKLFTAAELWNIQRRGRRVGIRIFSL